MTAQAEMTRLVRLGQFSLTYAACEPDVYGHVVRLGLFRVRWWITAGMLGPSLVAGWTWTRRGAWADAVLYAHHPCVRRRLARMTAEADKALRGIGGAS